MRFQEIRRLVEVGEGARKCMFDVLTSVWARFEMNSASAAGTLKEAEIDQRHHHSALALGGSLFNANVSNLWLSPQQMSLEGVMEGVDRVDGILKNLQHVTAITKGEYRSLQKHHKALKDKHDHLEERSEKEIIRKSGMKEFECQFNSNLRDPKDSSVQSDVTWLSRVPQMRETSDQPSKPEKVMYAMTAKVDDGMLMNDMRRRGAGAGANQARQDRDKASETKQRHVTVATGKSPVAVAVATSPKSGGGVSPTSPRKLSHWGTAKGRGAGSRRSMMMKAVASSLGTGQQQQQQQQQKQGSTRRTTLFG